MTKKVKFELGETSADTLKFIATLSQMFEETDEKIKITAKREKNHLKRGMKMKTIYIYGQSEAAAREYIRAHVKIVSDDHQLCGTQDDVLIILPKKEEPNIEEAARRRGFTVVEA